MFELISYSFLLILVPRLKKLMFRIIPFLQWIFMILFGITKTIRKLTWISIQNLIRFGMRFFLFQIFFFANFYNDFQQPQNLKNDDFFSWKSNSYVQFFLLNFTVLFIFSSLYAEIRFIIKFRIKYCKKSRNIWKLWKGMGGPSIQGGGSLGLPGAVPTPNYNPSLSPVDPLVDFQKS